MNPLQVSCPECQKLYFVRVEDLTAGESRFQCTACTKQFAFVWPQPPGVTKVTAKLIAAPAAESAPKTVAQRTCLHCGEKVDLKYKECPKCGIIFDKIKKVKPAEPPAQKAAATPDLTAAWSGVKTDYINLEKHEAFIQLCMTKENLAFASQQYRAIIDVNPSEEIANKMQNRIIELATFSYITANAKGGDKPRFAGLSKMMLVVSIILMMTGLLVTSARPLLPFGSMLLVFLLGAQYFAGKS